MSKKKLHKFFLMLLSTLLMSIPCEVRADLPVPITEEEIEFRTELSKVKDVYIYKSGGRYSTRELLKNINYSLGYGGPIFELSDAILQKKLKVIFEEYDPESHLSIYFEKPPKDKELRNVLEITFQYDITPTIFDSHKILLAAVQFNARLYPEGGCKEKGLSWYANSFNPESFILSNTTEVQKVVKDPSQPWSKSIETKTKIDKISPSFEAAIEITTAQIQHYLNEQTKRFKSIKLMQRTAGGMR